MICMSCTPPIDNAGRRATIVGRIAGTGRRVWRAYWDWRVRRATILLLRALDERTLRDIGIDASEIEFVVDQGRDRRRHRC